MAAVLLAFTFAALGTLTYWLFRISSPRSASPSDADAIVVLAGGSGERLATALSLVEDGVASTLVLSVGNRDWPGVDDLIELCDSNDDVVCIEPRPDSTSGEAATIAAEAARQGWQRLALVTSDYHLHRATVWFERCAEADILPVAAPASRNSDTFVHELGALAHATVLDRSCP